MDASYEVLKEGLLLSQDQGKDGSLLYFEQINQSRDRKNGMLLSQDWGEDRKFALHLTNESEPRQKECCVFCRRIRRRRQGMVSFWQMDQEMAAYGDWTRGRIYMMMVYPPLMLYIFTRQSCVQGHSPSH